MKGLPERDDWMRSGYDLERDRRRLLEITRGDPGTVEVLRGGIDPKRFYRGRGPLLLKVEDGNVFYTTKRRPAKADWKPFSVPQEPTLILRLAEDMEGGSI